MKVGVIGAGSWGCALAILLQNNGCQVSLWGHRREQIEKMQASGECDKLPGVMLPKEMSLTWDLSSCLLGQGSSGLSGSFYGNQRDRRKDQALCGKEPDPLQCFQGDRGR